MASCSNLPAMRVIFSVTSMKLPCEPSSCDVPMAPKRRLASSALEMEWSVVGGGVHGGEGRSEKEYSGNSKVRRQEDRREEKRR